MGWEIRGSSGRIYYYKKKKENGQVVSEYIGTGPHAARAASRVAAAQRKRVAAATIEQADRAAAAAREAELDAFCDLTDALVRAALLDAGYHRHHRGEWRKKRG